MKKSKQFFEATEILLKKAGLSVTQGRLDVLAYLMQKSRPVKIEELTQSLAVRHTVTLYRIVEQFIEHKIIEKGLLADGTMYVEFQNEHHHHITCTHCGIQSEINFCINEKKLLKNIKGFSQINQHFIELFGLCKNCT